MSLIITITDAGRAEIVNAQNTGTGPVLITEIGFGTGQYTPAPTQTALQAETKRISTLSGQVVAPDTIHVTVQDTSADTYNVGEFGLYTDSGTLFAVFSQAAAAGWIIEKASVSTLLLATDVIFSDIDAASLTFGDAAFLNPPATTTVQGVVELATSAETQAGTDTTRAVTPKALADTYTAADVLNKIKTVDGSGSGLDADLLDGIDSTGFAISTFPGIVDLNTITKSGMYRLESNQLNQPPNTDYGQMLVIHGGKDTITQMVFNYSAANVYIRSGNPPEVGANGAWTPWYKIWNEGNDGIGSGLDADLLDGQQGSYYSPAGAVSMFAMSTPPAGWLKANGAAISRTAYAALFAAIGTTFGTGDGSTTFNLPDLRGEFLRGFDDGRGVDSGRGFGSWQDHAVQDHTHSYRSPVEGIDTDRGTQSSNFSIDGTSVPTTGGLNSGNPAAETRPRNIALLACIKY
jgi:phage-related tail fiber protein